MSPIKRNKPQKQQQQQQQKKAQQKPKPKPKAKFVQKPTFSIAEARAQTRPYLVSALQSKTAMVRRVLASVVNPAENPPVRLGGEIQTSLSHLRLSQSVDFSGAPLGATVCASSASTALNLGGNYAFVLTRDPTKTLIIPQKSTSASYELQLVSVTATYDSGTDRDFIISIGTPGVKSAGRFPLVGAAWKSGDRIHGDYLFAPQHEGVNGIWINGWTGAGASLVVSAICSAGVACDITIIVDICKEGGTWLQSYRSIKQGVGAASVDYTFTLNDPGYYALRYQLDGTTNAGSITFGTANCYFVESATQHLSFGHLCAPNLFDQVQSFNEVKLNAASVLFSNNAPELYKNGTITAVQLYGQKNWQDLLQQDDPQNVMTQADPTNYYSGRYTMGSYVYSKPAREEDFSFPEIPWFVTQRSTSNTNAIVRTAAPMWPKSGVVVVFVRTVLTAAGTYAGGIGMLNADWHAEFAPSDQWFNAVKSDIPRAIVTQCIDEIASARNLFPNDEHWDNLKQVVSTGVNNAADAVGPVVSSFLKKAASWAGSMFTRIFG